MRYGLISAMEFRVNFFSWAIVSVIWASMFIVSIELIFGQTTSIAGWTKNEALLVVASLTLFVGIMWIFILPNMEEFSKLIRLGELDFYLLKPVNKRFLVSTKVFQYDQILRLILVPLLMVNIIVVNKMGVTLSGVLGYVTLLLIGMAIYYNIYFSLAITNFWLINVHNLDDFFGEFMDLGRWPVQIYRGFFSVLFVYIIPAGFVGTFPVQALLGRLDFGYYLWGIFIVVATFLFSHWFWNFALKHYTSASS